MYSHKETRQEGRHLTIIILYLSLQLLFGCEHKSLSTGYHLYHKKLITSSKINKDT